MRVLWFPVLGILAGLVVPTRAEPSATPLEASASATGSAATPEPAPPGGGLPVLPGTQTPDVMDNAVDRPVAFALNAPWGWFRGSAGLSAYVGLGQHHAVRANVARYEASAPLLSVVAVATGGDGAGYEGRIIDVGAAWVVYPRQLWDGFTFEGGVNRRDRDVSLFEEDHPVVRTQTATYAGRVMIGWSWLLSQHLFVAVAAGVSVGREAGHKTSTPLMQDPMVTTTTIDRTQIDTEGYVRFGVAL
jgi:hypothetical protein